MSTPALLRLREAHPAAAISILSHEKLADLWLRHPAINAVLSFAQGESVWSVARRLRSESFDLGLAFPNSFRSALELCLARIPRRVGYSGNGRNWLLTDSIQPRPGAVRMRKKSIAEINQSLRSGADTSERLPKTEAHHIHHYLHLASFVGARSEPLPPALFIDKEEAQTFLQRWKIDPSSQRPILGLNPGAEYGPAKRWPMERFVQAAVAIQQTLHCHWIIFGGPGDVELATTLSAQLESAAQTQQSPKADASWPNRGVINLAGQTTLRELCAGLKTCRVLLTNDSGPMHVAAAVGTRVIALYGSTSPELTGPGNPQAHDNLILKSNVACSPCFLRECPIDFRCMNGITVDQVVDAVVRLCGS